MGSTAENLNGSLKHEQKKLAVQVGERIREIRKEENLSLEALALRCDMNPAYVGHITTAKSAAKEVQWAS